MHIVCQYTHVVVCLWKSEGRFVELALSFHLYVGPGDGTQVFGLMMASAFYLVSRLTSLELLFFIAWKFCI